MDSAAKVSKKKNIITFEIPCGERRRVYYLDIATGVLITKTGKITNSICNMNAIASSVWGRAFTAYLHTNCLQIFSATELLLTEGYPESNICQYFISHSFQTIALECADLVKYKKYFHIWKLANPNEEPISLQRFISYAKYEEGFAQRGFYGKKITQEQFSTILKYLENPSFDELELFGYYINHNSYYFELSTEGFKQIKEYIDHCKFLNKTLQKYMDMFREFAETKRAYVAMKEEIDNEKFRANFQKQSKAWDFSYGDFTIVVPKEGKDLVREGLEMHHCVGQYVHRVVEGLTSIVFVRHKDAPEKCYITCQVLNDGTIGQYYLAYDRDISSETDIAFKQAFQKHLNEVWNN